NSWVMPTAAKQRRKIRRMGPTTWNLGPASPGFFFPATTSTTCHGCVPSATGRHSDQRRAAKGPPQLVDEPHTRIALFCKARGGRWPDSAVGASGRDGNHQGISGRQRFRTTKTHLGNRPV